MDYLLQDTLKNLITHTVRTAESFLTEDCPNPANITSMLCASKITSSVSVMEV